MGTTGLAARQRAYFRTGATLPVEARLATLAQLEYAVRSKEGMLLDALHADLRKTSAEGYMTEVGMVLEELRFARKHLRSWARPKRVRTPLAQFPARSFIQKEPYGAVLILAPWNYPVQLCLAPLCAALAAGNCVTLKPSAYAPHTSAALRELLSALFPPELVCVVEGGRAENAALLDQKWDYLFFTGSTAVGRVVLVKAAKHLTPCSLELGGKSPCIVDKTADIPLAARRIAFGKLLNAGQTCVAPDYLLIHRSVRDAFITAYRAAVSELYPTDEQLPVIINEKHYLRLCGLLEGEKDLLSGTPAPSACFLPPSLLDGVTWEAPVMGEEIFGPILPMLVYDELGTELSRLQEMPKPLALYLFTRDPAVEQAVLTRLSFGGGCVNDTIIHLASSRLPFGGVGDSGMGAYHGIYGFETFTHRKSIVRKGRLDLPMRYPPFTEGKLRLIRKFLG